MKKKIYLEIVLIYLAFLTISFFMFGNNVGNDWIKTELTVTSFVFASILAFSVTGRRTRLESIRKSLRRTDGILLNTYLFSKSFGAEAENECRKHIDNYLISSINYSLMDQEKAQPELSKLFIFICNLEYKNDSQKDIKGRMLMDIRDLNLSQKEMIHWAKEKIHPLESISLVSLASIIIYIFYALGNSSLLAKIIIPLVSTIFVLLLILVKNLDNLRWQEKFWIWNPLMDLFKDLDLPPYLPSWLFESGRLTYKDAASLKEYRKAYFPKPYPDFSDIKIEIVKNKA